MLLLLSAAVHLHLFFMESSGGKEVKGNWLQITLDDAWILQSITVKKQKQTVLKSLRSQDPKTRFTG